MALKLVVAPKARNDLNDLVAYIARDDSAAAARMLAQIEHTTKRLTEHPFLGPIVRAPAGLELRKITVLPYIVFYRILSFELQIVRVLHSSRDLSDARLYR